MPRHAGFALAAVVGEAYLNQTLWAAVMDLEPLSRAQLFTLPAVVPIEGGTTVRMSGTALFEQRPTLNLQANAGNRVAISASAIAFVAATTQGAQPLDQAETWKLRISARMSTLIDADIDPTGIYLRWMPAGSAIQSLEIHLLEGPVVTDWLAQALDSPDVRTAMNAALSAIGPQRISSKLFDSRIQYTKDANFPKSRFSVFEWFKIDLAVTRVALKVLDGAIALGADLEGLTSGDESQLVNLLLQPGDGVLYRCVRRGNSLPGERPVLAGTGPRQAAGDIAVLFNADVLTALSERVSAQISGTPIDPRIRLTSIRVFPAFFEKTLRGREIGIQVDFAVDHFDLGRVDGKAFLQPYVLVDGEPGPARLRPLWKLWIAQVEIDAPWWVDIAIATAGVVLTVLVPPLVPLVAVGIVASLDGIVPSVVSDANTQSANALGSGVMIAPASTNTTLPTARRQAAYASLDQIVVSNDGIGLLTATIAPEVRFARNDATAEVARLSAAFHAGSPAPYGASVELRADLTVLGPECSVQLIVRRGDNGEELARSEGPYATHRSVSLDHMTESLYFLDEFEVEARLFVNRRALKGLLFAARGRVRVTDTLDRHHPYVSWPNHWAHFRNRGTNGAWWHRLTHHTLHRTAVTARCLALRERSAALERAPTGMPMEYHDDTPVPFEQLPAHRRLVCPYCFFGGPTRAALLPQQDWFS